MADDKGAQLTEVKGSGSDTDRHIREICNRLRGLVRESNSLIALIASHRTDDNVAIYRNLNSIISDSRRTSMRLRELPAQTLSCERRKQSILASALELEAEESPPWNRVTQLYRSPTKALV
jgi:hypothetical protein